MDFEYFIRKIGFEEEDINTLVCLYDKVKYTEAFKGLVNEMRANRSAIFMICVKELTVMPRSLMLILIQCCLRFYAPLPM